MDKLPSYAQEKINEVKAYGLPNLSLSFIPLTAEILSEIISELFWLQELQLNYCELTELPDNIGQLKLLALIKLSNNQITTLPETFSLLQNLKEISLSHNQIQKLPDEFSKLHNVETLNLSENHFKKIPDVVMNLSGLKSLFIANNDLEFLPDSISNLTNLETLNLSGNRLTVLPDAFANLTKLKNLLISHNNLEALPDSISHLDDLETLNISSNHLRMIPDVVVSLYGLKNLVASNNYIETLHDNISNLTNLEILNLSSNNLRKLPKAIAYLSELKNLALAENNLEDLPEGDLSFSKLEILNVANNKLKTIPESFMQLRELRELILGENNITALPESISNLKNLVRLNLASNSLSELPDSICELLNLYEFRCSHNFLQELPEGMQKLSNLSSLSLASNKFKIFPEVITKLSSLVELRLANNELVNISDDIGKLTSLQYLSISYNELTDIPESISNLPNLSYISLRNNKIKNLPDFSAKFSNLRTLKISGNETLDDDSAESEVPKRKRRTDSQSEDEIHIDDLTANTSVKSDVQLTIEEVNNKKLKTLNLSHQGLRIFPLAIFELIWLEELDISYNFITEIPIELLKLSNLSEFNVKGNPLSTPFVDLAEKGLQFLLKYLETKRLISIQLDIVKKDQLNSLDLSGYNLVDIPDEVIELEWLEELDLSNNQIKKIPDKLINFPNLSKLNLDNNPLDKNYSDLVNQGVSAVFQYLNLQNRLDNVKRGRISKLNLSGLSLETLPFEIFDMDWLEELDLSNNKLKELPDELSKISNLKTLLLFRNQLQALPLNFTRLTKLQHLNVSGNQIKELPSNFGNLMNLISLNVSGNPLEIPPIEVAKQGVKSIAQYFTQLDEVGKSHLYEAKLLLVGEPGAGKTTLARKLRNPTSPLPSENESTKGIDIILWSFPQLDKPDFRVNIWDFAGQEIYYATHRFFLTHNALYLLVADTRKDDTYFDYWLNIISLLSQNSPILIIANEKDDRYRHFNINTLRGYFTNLKDVLRTNLANRRGLQEIYQEIEHYITSLPHVGKVLPSTWVRVREVLEKTHENYLSARKFFHICEKAGFKEYADKLQLSDYLHTIGVVLHYQNDPVLKHTIFLNPEWCTSAIYKALDTKEIIKNNGLFTRKYLMKIWKDDEYLEVLDELLQLMLKFNLCYPLPSIKDTYIVPQLLPEESMPFDWNDNENLFLQYEYQFMPKGMLWLFIIAVHTFIKEQVYVWRSGVVISKDGATAEVVEYYHSRRITIRISGQNKRDLMSVIRYEFEKIHRIYHQLEYAELVPCNCASCHGNEAPHFYDLKELLERVQNKKDKIECRKKPYNMVRVHDLLDDILGNEFEIKSNDKRIDASPYTHIENAYFQGNNNPVFSSKEIGMTKNLTISNIHGSAINVDSAFESVIQTINTIDGIQGSETKELNDLVQELKLQLKNLPSGNLDEFDKITKRLDAFLKEAADKSPDQEVVQVNGASLIKAAKNIESVMPSVLNIAQKIVKFVSMLTFRN